MRPRGLLRSVWNRTERFPVFAIACLALCLAAGSAFAQETESPPAVDPAAPDPAQEAEADSDDDLDALLSADEAEAQPEEDDLSLIEDLLAEGDDALQTNFVYDGGGRRDPFRSLLVVVDQVSSADGPRPEGIPGLLIDEVTLTGVWVTPQGPVAQVQSADQAVSYLLREGDRLFDGDVISITHSRDSGGEIRFRQIVDDPTAPKPFRDVVRKLEP